MNFFSCRQISSADLQNVIDGAITFQPQTSVNHEFTNYIKKRTMQEAIESNRIFEKFSAYISDCSNQVIQHFYLILILLKQKYVM